MVNIEFTYKLIQNLSTIYSSINIQEQINKKKESLTPNMEEFKQQIQTSFLISNIPPEGILINQPGIYTFENNIQWTPAASISSIFIESNDVILDLQNFSLKCINPLNLQTIGIYISVFNNNI
jgi:hypothetical protein